MPKGKRRNADTAQRILDIAERLVQTRGFNGFSYADISAAIGITKASLHYHFPTKAELGKRLIEQYEQRFLDALATIDRADIDAREMLRRYTGIYVDVVRNKRMCLCGMLASDYATLAKPVREGVKRFFDRNEEWLVAVLERGRASGALHFKGSPEVVARGMLGALARAPYEQLSVAGAPPKRLGYEKPPPSKTQTFMFIGNLLA